jgi:hypothetical protein
MKCHLWPISVFLVTVGGGSDPVAYGNQDGTYMPNG